MRLGHYAFVAASASLIGNAQADFLPKLFSWGMTLTTHLMVRNGYKYQSVIVFVSQSSQALFDSVQTCTTAEGTTVGK